MREIIENFPHAYANGGGGLQLFSAMGVVNFTCLLVENLNPTNNAISKHYFKGNFPFLMHSGLVKKKIMQKMTSWSSINPVAGAKKFTMRFFHNDHKNQSKKDKGSLGNPNF